MKNLLQAFDGLKQGPWSQKNTWTDAIAALEMRLNL
jgi:hypothetical protein